MLKRAWWLVAGGAILVTTLAAFQMPWRVYTSMEPYDDIPLPPDYKAVGGRTRPSRKCESERHNNPIVYAQNGGIPRDS